MALGTWLHLFFVDVNGSAAVAVAVKVLRVVDTGLRPIFRLKHVFFVLSLILFYVLVGSLVLCLRPH